MSTKQMNLKQVTKKVAGGLLDLVYPPRCPGCDEILEQGELICKECDNGIRRVGEPVCKRCGKTIDSEQREYCSDCMRKEHNYRQGKSVFIYEGRIKQSMYRFKYANKREYAGFYAREAVRLHKNWIYKNNIEAIIPIPMYAGKRRRRGYNQADVFAKALGNELGIPVETRLVKRVKNTIPQKQLNDRQRRQNLKNAFQLMSNIVEYKQVLLVDDIYTTGSTMDAVAEILCLAGVKNIYYICISIGVGY